MISCHQAHFYFIINRFSGGYQQNHKILEQLVSSAKIKWGVGRVVEIDIANTNASFFKNINRPAILFIGGGDGTVSSVAQYILGDKQVGIAIIPLGTGNDLARAFFFYEWFRKGTAFDSLIKNDILPLKSFTLWQLGDRFILNYLSIGFDAEVVHRFHDKRENIPKALKSSFVNKILYFLCGIRYIFHRIRGLEILLPDNRFNITGVFCCILSNISSYAGGVRLDNSSINLNKELRIRTFKNLFSYLKLLLGFNPHLLAAVKDKCELVFHEDMFIQIDGEPINWSKGKYLLQRAGEIQVLMR